MFFPTFYDKDPAAAHCNEFYFQGRILHRDLKPANVFLTGLLGDVKLGDFGLARVLHNDVSMAVSYVGTPYYMSPEQVNGQRYNEVRIHPIRM